MILEYCIKGILIGPSASGKTSFLKSIKYEDIPKKHIPTVGVEYDYIRSKKNNDKYKVCIWDTSGSNSFLKIVESYYSHSAFCIIMFDLNSSNSFNEAINWFQQYKSIKPNDLIILVGNKYDKLDHKTNEGLSYGNIPKIKPFIDKHNIPYIEISALTRYNVQELITFIINDINVKIKSNQIIPNDPSLNRSITLHKYVNGSWVPYEYKNTKNTWFNKKAKKFGWNFK